MVRRIIFGVLWCVVLYFTACAVTGAIAGGIASNEDPANAAAAGAQAGARAVTALRGYLLVGAVALSALGTWAGFLPGTRAKRTSKHAI